jgi:glyoxylase-like metal-dependent hydrolase (beta-lactamase superfamily II)
MTSSVRKQRDALTHEWFRVRQVDSGIWLIAEPPHVNTWLVAGSERAALLDTGMGVAPIRPLAEAIARVPVTVVNTHSHFDHVGGNHEFDDILIHPLGAPLLEDDVPAELLAGYLAYVEELERALPAYLATDRRFLFALTAADEPRPFPAAARSGGWRIPASRASGTLEEGDRVDLGGRELTVLHTPGHSPDHVALLLEREGVLFAGDAVSTGAVYAQWPESDVSAFAASAARLAALAPDLRVVHVHHFQRHSAPPSLLADVAAGFAALLRGDVGCRPNRDCAGQAVREAVFSEFSIYLPEEEPLDG